MLALYRILVPAHATIASATVEAWLAMAAASHSATRWGGAYSAAMIMWAAAHLEPQRAAGVVGVVGRVCALPADAAAAQASVSVESTTYWRLYLDYRGSRAAAAPSVIR